MIRVDLVRHICCTQVASWAGNLMLKWHHRDFVSDIFIVLEAVQAKIKISKYFQARPMTLTFHRSAI